MSAGWMAMRAGKRARAWRAARQKASVERRRPGERLAQLSTTLARERAGRRVVDAQVVLGEAIPARREQREEPRRHRPRGRDEAVDAQPGSGEDALALVDARAPLVGRHVAHLGLAARHDALREEPREAPRAGAAS